MKLNPHWWPPTLPALGTPPATAAASRSILRLSLANAPTLFHQIDANVLAPWLIDLAERLAFPLRALDQCARIGEGEFLFALQHREDACKVEEFAQELLAVVESCALIPDGVRYAVHCAIGISHSPQGTDDSATLLHRAELALVAAKTRGRNQITTYGSLLTAEFLAAQDLEQELEAALHAQQFILHYQVKVDMRSGAVCGMEALVRWQHPVRGLLGPDTFIPLAEHTGQIVRLGACVIWQAVAQLACWRQQQLRLVPVSINVSARQFVDGTLADTLLSAARQYYIPPGLLELEVTESMAIADIAHARSQLQRLADAGIKILLDDFGTAYAAIANVHHLGPDKVKLDKSFIASMTENTGGQKLVYALLQLARVLELGVVAEGVETSQQLTALLAMDCHEMQGYFFARPVAPDEIPALLDARWEAERGRLPLAAGVADA